MSERTPGPWQSYWKEENGVADCGVFWEKHLGQAYSVCRAPRHVTKEQWEADGAFIAAAPEIAAERDRLKEERAELLKIATLALAYICRNR